MHVEARQREAQGSREERARQLGAALSASRFALSRQCDLPSPQFVAGLVAWPGTCGSRSAAGLWGFTEVVSTEVLLVGFDLVRSCCFERDTVVLLKAWLMDK